MRGFIIMIMIGLLTFGESPIYFRTKDNLPIIQTTINGKGGKFLVDTGASISLVDYSLRELYGFDVYQYDMGNAVFGIDGRKEVYQVENLVVMYDGDFEIKANFMAMDIRNLRLKYGISGILGSDWLNKNEMIIDFKKRVITKGKMFTFFD